MFLRTLTGNTWLKVACLKVAYNFQCHLKCLILTIVNAKPNAKQYLGVRLILNGLKTNIFEESIMTSIKTSPAPQPEQSNDIDFMPF